jgi:ketol-acid reductoisomerase
MPITLPVRARALTHRRSPQACSTTARRGALDWAPVFEKANLPVFEALYESVKNGTETRKSLEFNGRKTYREDLAKELEEINNQEIWRAGTPLSPKSLATEFGISCIILWNLRKDCANPATGA